MAIIEGTSFSYVTELPLPFAEAKAKVLSAFEKQGFGPVSEIDLQAKMKEKLDEDMLQYQILGMCNPRLAMRAISAEPNIGVLLPCNVILRESGKSTVVAAQRPEKLIRIAEGSKAVSVAQIADALILEALKGL